MSWVNYIICFFLRSIVTVTNDDVCSTVRKKLDMTELQSLSVSERKRKGNFLSAIENLRHDRLYLRKNRSLHYHLNLIITFLEPARTRNVADTRIGGELFVLPCRRHDRPQH